MSKKSIKQTYSDVLFWVTSPMSKGKRYHITYAQESVLRKLIHYSDGGKKRFINYSNESISSHIYMSEEHLKKIIPKLNKVGYISVSNKKHYKDGEFKTSRTIMIDWDFIETIVPDLPKLNFAKEIEESNNISEDDSGLDDYSKIQDLENYFNPEDEMNLFDVLPRIGFDIDDVIYIISKMSNTNNTFNDFLKCINELKNQAKYNDYEGPILTSKIKQNIKFIWNTNK